MNESFKSWWSTNEPHEKNALIVLGVILSGIFFFSSGIALGRIAAALM